MVHKIKENCRTFYCDICGKKILLDIEDEEILVSGFLVVCNSCIPQSEVISEVENSCVKKT
jgi:hypothetical protein